MKSTSAEVYTKARMIPRLAGVAVIALLAPSCMMPGYWPEQGGMAPHVARPDPVRGKFPDPKYRAPVGMNEIEEIARAVVRGSGKRIRIEVKQGRDPSPPCIVRGNRHQGVIEINPRAARQIPANSWAFIFGHEIAHLVEDIGPHSGTSPAVELKADIYGARYAMNAGFQLAPYLGWLMTLPDTQSISHGSIRSRARAMAREFKISEAEIQRHRARHISF